MDPSWMEFALKWMLPKEGRVSVVVGEHEEDALRTLIIKHHVEAETMDSMTNITTSGGQGALEEAMVVAEARLVDTTLTGFHAL
jgi:hypothetical protein